VASAKEQGHDDIAFVLDEERRESRRKLMDALAMADEAAAIKGVLAVSAQIDEAFATWRAFESEAREEKLAAHARLPFWKRPFDLDKDGHVSFQEKRFIVTITLLILTTIACVVLVGLLTKHFVDSRINPLTTAEFNEVESLKLPPMSFCIEGPAFPSYPTARYPGVPLFSPVFWKPPAPVGTAEKDRPQLDINETVLQELPGSRVACSSEEGSLSSADNALDCIFCYQLTRDVVIRHGATAEENVRSDLQLQFESFEPFVECLTRPTNLDDSALAALRAQIKESWAALVSGGILGGDATGADTAPADTMPGLVACNAYFFSDYFYPRRAGEVPVAYTMTAAVADPPTDPVWTLSAGTPYTNELVLADFTLGVEVHILDFSALNSTQEAHDHRSIPGFPVGNARADSLTQVLLNKRTIAHKIREGRQKTRSEDLYRAKVDYYPRVFQEVREGFNQFFLSIAIGTLGGGVGSVRRGRCTVAWPVVLVCRSRDPRANPITVPVYRCFFFALVCLFSASLATDNFIVESYSNSPTYTVPMYLEQLLGYVGNFVRALARNTCRGEEARARWGYSVSWVD